MVSLIISNDTIEVINDSAWLFFSESIVAFCSIFNGILPFAFGRGLGTFSVLPAAGILNSFVFFGTGTAGFLEATGSILTSFFYTIYFSFGFLTSLGRTAGRSA